MHATETSSGVTFHHHGDDSGDVKVQVSAVRVELDGDDAVVEVPFAAMHELVMGYLRDKMVEALETLDADGVERLALGVVGGD